MSERANILVVDDEKGVREGLRRILATHDYAVQVAGDASEALEALKEDSFELVLTDLQMPGMDGLELLDEIKRRSPQLPVIIITAYGTMDVAIQALRHDVSDFVTKPFQAEEILTIVDREVARYEVTAPMEGMAAPIGLQFSSRQLDEIEHLLAQLRAETAARCVLLIEGTGHLIDAKGVIDDLNVAALASLVAGDFAATSSIASLIGEDDAFRMNYHEGEYYSVYSAQVAPQVFLLIIFGQDIKLGSVLYYARQVVPDLKEIASQGVEPPPSMETGKAPSVGPPATKPEQKMAPVMPQQPVSSSSASSSEEGSGTGEESGSGELYTLDEIQSAGLLDDDALNALDEKFTELWSAGAMEE
jgi:CheY-like chemotaxis protein